MSEEEYKHYMSAEEFEAWDQQYAAKAADEKNLFVRLENDMRSTTGLPKEWFE